MVVWGWWSLWLSPMMVLLIRGWSPIIITIITPLPIPIPFPLPIPTPSYRPIRPIRPPLPMMWGRRGRSPIKLWGSGLDPSMTKLLVLFPVVPFGRMDEYHSHQEEGEKEDAFQTLHDFTLPF